MLTKKTMDTRGGFSFDWIPICSIKSPAIVENMTDFLESRGYLLDFAMDGITLCRKLRREADKQVPVIMLTARDTLDDKLLGFESGPTITWSSPLP